MSKPKLIATIKGTVDSHNSQIVAAAIAERVKPYENREDISGSTSTRKNGDSTTFEVRIFQLPSKK